MTEESRLARWSRLKTKSRPKGRGIFFKAPAPDTVEETDAEPLPAEVNPAEGAPGQKPADAAEAAKTPEKEPDFGSEEDAYPEDLPSIESLTKDSDFTAFMSERVSDAIRNAALRKLWVSNPALANLDGLVDYGEDLTGSFRVVDNMQSAYKVGRGMVDYEAEAKLAEERALKKESSEPPADTETTEDLAADDKTGIEQAESEDQGQDTPDDSSPDQVASDPDTDAEIIDTEQVAQNSKIPVSNN